MENQLITSKGLSTSEIMTIAKTFAESGMFSDTKQAAQAFVKIQAGQEIGIPPFQSMSGIHIILGKVAIGAGVMASRVKGSGKYDYKVIQQDETKCSIDFFQGKTNIGNSTFTIEDAKKAGTQNLNKFPRNMLFARAISNGVKWYTPDVFSGPIYVPEELNIEQTEQVNQTVDVQHEEVKKESLPKFVDPVLEDLKKEFLILVDNEHFSGDEKDSYCAKMDKWTVKAANTAIQMIKEEIMLRESQINNPE